MMHCFQGLVHAWTNDPCLGPIVDVDGARECYLGIVDVNCLGIDVCGYGSVRLVPLGIKVWAD
jgi:hypothetical protein